MHRRLYLYIRVKLADIQILPDQDWHSLLSSQLVVPADQHETAIFFFVGQQICKVLALSTINTRLTS